MPQLSLEDNILVALRRITRAIDLHSRGLMQGIGLTAPQLAALKAIARMQPVTSGELARSIHLSQATLTGILSRLEKRNLVTRSRSGADRRAVVVELTEQGQRDLASSPSLLQDRFRRELWKLGEWEQTQMLATLQRIASMMDAEDIDAVPMLAAGDAAVEELPQFLNGAVTTDDRGEQTRSMHESTDAANSHSKEMAGTETLPPNG